jgi:hypothetical protein
MKPLRDDVEAAEESGAREARRAEARRLTDAAHAAVDRYARLLDASLLAGASSREDVASLVEGSRAMVERELRDAVAALCELRTPPPSPIIVVAPGEVSLRASGVRLSASEPAANPELTSVEGLEAPASEPSPSTRRRVVDVDARSPSGSEGRLRASAAPLDPDGKALIAEFESLDFDGLSDAEFVSHATELAARVRFRQERGLIVVGQDIEGRILRALTGLANARPLGTPVFGLSRTHRGNWAALARKAREDRERRGAAAQRANRMASYSSSRMPVGKPATDPGEDDGGEDAPLDVPLLAARSRAAQVVIVGGVAKPEKLARVRRSTGIAVEWVGLDAGKSAATVASLAKRIREGRLAALVFLNGLMDHKQSEPLLAAAREVGLPTAYADKAGGAALARAFLELEKRCGGGKTPAG